MNKGYSGSSKPNLLNNSIDYNKLREKNKNTDDNLPSINGNDNKNVMDEIGGESDMSDLKVPHNAVIETVAEAVLNDPKPVAVIDDNNEKIGVLHRKSIIHILFGKEESTGTPQSAGA